MRYVLILLLLAFHAPSVLGAATHYTMCRSGLRHDCVVNGDTFWFKRTKIQIEGVDAPEVSSPDCSAELALGRRALERLLGLLNSADWHVQKHGLDIYKRRLATVTLGNIDIGKQLIRDDLA